MQMLVYNFLWTYSFLCFKANKEGKEKSIKENAFVSHENIFGNRNDQDQHDKAGEDTIFRADGQF